MQRAGEQEGPHWCNYSSSLKLEHCRPLLREIGQETQEAKLAVNNLPLVEFRMWFLKNGDVAPENPAGRDNFTILST
jgi:hypothetical protein